MINGFQLDSKSKSVPVGLRIVLTLRSPDKDKFTLAISALGVIQNYAHRPRPPKPDPKDEVWIEPTPESKRQRFIIHTPGNQRILLGDFPFRIAIEISVEREVPTGWLTTNKVLVVLDKSDIEILQAREFALNKQKLELAIVDKETDKNFPAEILDRSDLNETNAESSAEEVAELDLVQISDSDSIDNSIQPVFETLDQSESVVLIADPETQPIESTKWRKRVNRLLTGAVGFCLIAFAVFSFTPLSWVSLDQPENEKFNVAISLPIAEPTVGDNVVATLVDVDGNYFNYAGKVENKSKDTYLVSNAETIIQVDATQIKGRVVIKIPFVGILSNPIN